MVLTLDAILAALLIFVLRVFNNGLATIRVVLITRDKRMLAAAIAFIEAFTFAVVFANIVKDLNNVLNMFAYCIGFSVGGYVGMALEARLITSYVIAMVVLSVQGHETAEGLREKGFGVTEVMGEGREGHVTILRSVLTRRELPLFREIINQFVPEAFISIEEVRSVQSGWVGRVQS